MSAVTCGPPPPGATDRGRKGPDLPRVVESRAGYLTDTSQGEASQGKPSNGATGKRWGRGEVVTSEKGPGLGKAVTNEKKHRGPVRALCPVPAPFPWGSLSGLSLLECFAGVGGAGVVRTVSCHVGAIHVGTPRLPPQSLPFLVSRSRFHCTNTSTFFHVRTRRPRYPLLTYLLSGTAGTCG